MVGTNRRIKQLAFPLESYGSDGASFSDDDRPAQRSGELNSFMWPMYVIVSKENRTLPWGLQVFTTEAGSYPEPLTAASTVCVVFPVVILFLFARKYFVRGVARGRLEKLAEAV